MSNRVLILSLLTLVAYIPAVAQDRPIRYGPGEVISLDELPRMMRQDAGNLQSIDPGRLKDYVVLLPELVLDGAVIEIMEGSEDVSYGAQTISARRISIINGGKIVTNGYDLVINTAVLESDAGEIVAFVDHFVKQAEVGANGLSGRPGGTLLLNVGKIERHSLLHVNLDGEPGQPGGNGAAGFPGTLGARGEDARSFAQEAFFKCSRPGGTGGPGGRGGPGQPGGAGGDGGDGGYLVLRGAIAKSRLAIQFTALGGEGGKGGQGGPGGPGGKGGDGGRGSAACPGGQIGPDGPPGERGLPGPDGSSGRVGSIRPEYE